MQTHTVTEQTDTSTDYHWESEKERGNTARKGERVGEERGEGRGGMRESNKGGERSREKGRVRVNALRIGSPLRALCYNNRDTNREQPKESNTHTHTNTKHKNTTKED